MNSELRNAKFMEWQSKLSELDPDNALILIDDGSKGQPAKFIVNRWKLEASSPKFKKILEDGPTRGYAYEIQGISAKDFQMIIEYIFQLAPLDLPQPRDAEHLYEIAQRFEISRLQNEIFNKCNKLQQTGPTNSISPPLITKYPPLAAHSSSSDVNPQKRSTYRQYDDPSTEKENIIALRNLLDVLANKNQLMQSTIIRQNEENKNLHLENRSLQQKLQVQETHLQLLRLENKDKEVKHLEEINQQLCSKLEMRNDNDRDRMEQMEAKIDSQANDFKRLEMAFLELRTEIDMNSFKDCLEEQETLKSVQQLETNPGTLSGSAEKKDRLSLFTSFQSKLQEDDFAIACIIENLTLSTMKFRDNYFYWTGASVKENDPIPIEIPSGTTKSFIIAGSKDIAGYVCYRLEDDVLFFMKYCIATEDCNHNDFQIAFCTNSFRSGMAWLNELRFGKWKGYDDRVQKYAVTSNFAKCSKLETSVKFGKFEAKASMNTGRKALITIVISEC